MDEPLGALDKNLRESMQYEIKHIHESIGVTVVYVTHDQSEALTCLLYTSPSPRDATLSRMPSSA